MKRAVLLLALSLAFIPKPAESRGILILVDSLATAAEVDYGLMQRELGPLMDTLSRSMRPGFRITVSNLQTSGTFANPTWTLSELKDSVSPTAASPKYDYDLIIAVACGDNNFLYNPAGNNGIMQLSLAANRPKVPVLYIGALADLTNNTGLDSLGVTGQIDLSASTAFVTSPAGFAFPTRQWFTKKQATGAGLYVTPVLWLAFYNFTKANPNGVGGTNSTGAAVGDTVSAWFYNPPIVSTRVGIANAAGYGAIHWERHSISLGTVHYAPSGLSLVTVGMAARLAPACFKFPAQNVALDVDDGCKRFSTASSLPQIQDAFAGLDSLGAWKIPYALGIEIDSMNTPESNGLTRFQNEFQAARRYGMGRFTVHCHKGMLAGGVITDTTIASAANHIHTDIFGKGAARWSLVGPSAATKDQSTLSQLNDATKMLIDYAGDVTLVTSHVMPPTDDYSTDLVKTVAGNASNYDSVGYAIALAGSGYKGFPGYTVVRSQFRGSSANVNDGGAVGGINHGIQWPLPSLGVIAAGLSAGYKAHIPRLLYATSQYLYGQTDDTVSVQDHANLRGATGRLIGNAIGFNRNTDMTTAQEATADFPSAYVGVAKGVIWVTHLPNYRAGIGVSASVLNVYGGSRPAWEQVRIVHGEMEAARWAAMQANTATTTYFTDGPMKWVYPDRITEKDLR